MKIPLAQQLKAAQDELEMRKRVYSRFVKDKRMSQQKADSKIADMQAIVDTLDDLYRTECKVLDSHAKAMLDRTECRITGQRFN